MSGIMHYINSRFWLLATFMSLWSGFAVCQTPQWQWMQTGGGSGLPGSTTTYPNNDQIISSAFDNEGNLIVGGTITQYVTFDTLRFSNATADSHNFFLAKYDKCRNLLWVRMGGGSDYDDISNISTDDSGNIYTMGNLATYNGTASVYTPSKDTTFTFCTHQLSKFDKNGNLISIKAYTWGTALSIAANSMKRLKSGNFLTVLRNTSPLPIGNYSSPRNARNFVVFDTSFSVVKVVNIDTIWRSGSTLDYVMDENENIYFSVDNPTYDSVIFLGRMFNPAPIATAFLIKTDTSFIIKAVNSSGYRAAPLNRLRYSNGFLYGSGRPGGGGRFDWDTVPGASSFGHLRAYKIDTNLHLVWVSKPSVQNLSVLWTELMPGAGKNSLYLAYQHRGNVVWDSANLTTPGNTYQMAIFKINTSDGVCVKGQFTSGTPSSKDQFGIINTDAQGNAYFMGMYANTIGVPGDVNQAYGGTTSLDFFILKWGLGCNDTLNSLDSPQPSDSLVATGTGSQTIHVQWRDVSDYEQGFHVYRSPDGISNWTLAGTTGHNVAQFDDTGLNPNTVYWYKAAAYSQGGESGFTNIDSARTLAGLCSAQISTNHTDSVYTFSSANTGTGPYTYQWSLNGANFSTATNPTRTISTPGQYIVCVTVTDNGQCTAADCDTFTVAPNCATLQVTNAVATPTNCNGDANGNITITTTGGYSPYQYKLNSGAYQSANVFNGLSAGNYTVQVRDTAGCAVTYASPVTISQPALLAVTVSQTDVTTVGGSDGSATATVTGGTRPYAYFWNNFTNDSTITALPAGTYCVVATDANGCSVSACATVNEPSCTGFAVTTASHVDASCNGSADGTITVTATGGNIPYQYKLNGGVYQTANLFSALSAGNYTVQVRDTAGCTATYSSVVTIAQPNALSVSVAHTDVTTVGGNDGTATATVTGGIPGYTYNWSHANNGNPITGLTSGNYCLTVSDSRNCTATGCTFVNQPGCTGFSVSAVNTTNVTCFGLGNGAITITATGGNAPYQYAINGGTYQSTNSFTALAPGSYTVQAKDTGGCIATYNQPVVISEPASLTINTTHTNITVNGANDGTATATATGGTGSLFFSWSNGDTGPQIDSLAAGFVCVTVTDANSCSAATCDTLTEPAAVCATGITHTNTGSVYSFTATNTGNGPYSYQWSLNASSFSAQAAPSFAIFAIGVNSVCVTVTDANNCTATDCDTITIAALTCATTLNYAATDTGYLLATINTGTAPFNYQWSLNGNSFDTAANPFLASPAAGTYNFCVTVTDANSCTATDCEVILVTGIQVQTAMQVKLFPNPASNYAQLLVAADKELNVQLTITDVNGRLIKESTIVLRRGINLYDINCSQWAAGIYQVQLRAGSIVWSDKLIKD